MDKYAVKEFIKEYKGGKYKFPLGVHARNVETDDAHQFMTKTEKESIKSTTEKVGKLPEFGDAAGCGIANNDTTTEPGYLADARIVKTHGDEIDDISMEVTNVKQAFTDGCNVLVSTCTTYGAAPASNSPTDIAAAIAKIYNNRYVSGYDQGIKDATPSIERKDFSITATNHNNETMSYPIQNTGTAYIALHMYTIENYDCARGVSNPGYEILIGENTVFKEYPWEESAAQDGDTREINCFIDCEVTAGQVLTINYNGGYLCNTHLGGSVIIVN